MKTNWRALRCGCLIVAGVILGGKPAIARAQDATGADTPGIEVFCTSMRAPAKSSTKRSGF